MAANRDVFGFDELLNSFKKMERRYPNAADRMLMTQGRAALNKVKQLTPTGPRPKQSANGRPVILKSNWRLKRVKEYQGGKFKVVRIQSEAPHAHLVENGHEIYRGGRARGLNTLERRVRGIRHLGRVEGNKMLEKAIQEAEEKFGGDTQALLDRLIEEANL